MSWLWLLPWRRRTAREVYDDDRRLDESEQLKQRAEKSARDMRGHLRRNRFGEMLDREIFGGP